MLMTRRELNDPFGSDDEDEQQSGSQKTTNSDANAESQKNNIYVNKVESPISNLDPATANVRNSNHFLLSISCEF